MTFSESKTLLSSLLYGDTKVPDDAVLIPLYKLGFQEVSTATTPLKLLTGSKDFTLFRIIKDGVYLRTATLPTNDADKLDIDNELAPAVVFFVASYLSKNKAPYLENKAMVLVEDYNWKLYESNLIMEGNDDC